MALLEVTDLSIRYGYMGPIRAALSSMPSSFEAVAGISFAIPAGKTLGVVRESGSGKSTVARTLIGLKRASAGTIRFEDRDITHASARDYAALRRDMAMMWQDATGSLSPRMKVASLLVEPMRIHGGRIEADTAERLLGMVGLPADFAGRYPHQLSGGQARRVGVARALALDPKLLIADEPTAGLDMSVQAEVLNLLAELQERTGVAILVISHNLNVVRHITDRVAVMYLGRIVEEGPTEEIFAHPRHPYTAALLSANAEPDPDARKDRIVLSGEVPSPFRRPSGCEFHSRCPVARPDCASVAPPVTIEGARRYTCRYPL